MNKKLETVSPKPPLSYYTNDWQVAKTGFFVVAVVIGIFGVWASWAPLQSAVLAQGVVTVEGYRKSVQHLEGGIVRSLHVRDGDWVQAGDILLTLEDTSTRAELEMLQGQWIAARAGQVRLQAELTGAEMQLPEDMAETDAAWRNERAVFLARQNALMGEIEVWEKNIAQTQSLVAGNNQVIKSKERVAASFEEEAKDLRALLKDGYVDKQRLREHERSLSGVAADISELRSQIAQSQQKISETNLQIIQRKKQFLSEVSQLLSEKSIQVNDFSERLRAVKERLGRTQIKAPSEGRVIAMAVHTEGGVVAPGAVLMDIVPENDNLIVDAKIAPKDIDQISKGKKAEVRFSSFNSRTTPVIAAEVVSVSVDRLVNEKDGSAYYLSRVRITDDGEKKLNGLQLLPGMPAEVLITTDQRTLAQYLLQPAKNAFARSLIEE